MHVAYFAMVVCINNIDTENVYMRTKYIFGAFYVTNIFKSMYCTRHEL